MNNTQVEANEMDLLAQYEPLTELVKIYIPSTIDINIEIDNGSYVTDILEQFSNMFGGASAQKVVGAWMSDKKGLVTENVTCVYSYASKLDIQTKNKLVKLAKYLKNEMKQEAIALEVNGNMHFIQ